MDDSHHLVHQKRLFSFHVEDIDLDTAQTIELLIVTGAKRFHLTDVIEVIGGQVTLNVYRNAVASNNGTEQSLSPFNDETTASLLTKVYLGPTLTGDGTLWYPRRALGFAQGASKLSSSLRGNAERVLRANTKYLFRFTSAADNVAVTADFAVYET